MDLYYLISTCQWYQCVHCVFIGLGYYVICETIPDHLGVCIGHCVRVVLDHHCVATVYFSKFPEELVVCMCMAHVFILCILVMVEY